MISTIVMEKAFEDMTTYGYSRLITDLCLFVVAYRCYTRPSKNRRSFDFPRQPFFEACLLARSGCRNDQDTFGFVGRMEFELLVPVGRRGRRAARSRRRNPRALHVSGTVVASAFAASPASFEQTLFLRSVPTIFTYFLFDITVPRRLVALFHRSEVYRRRNLRRWLR